jgi:hypothetical protein
MARPKGGRVPPVLPDHMKAENLLTQADAPEPDLLEEPEVEEEGPSLAAFAQQHLGDGLSEVPAGSADDLETEDEEDFRPIGGAHEMSVHETQEASPVHPAVHLTEAKPWVDPANLDAPPPRSGMVQRWIRVESGGRADAMNASRKFREGWKPRPASTVPKGYHPPTINHGALAGVIGVDGLVLCEMPAEQNERRKLAMRSRIDGQTQAIDEQIHKVQQPGNPILRSQKTFVQTRGRIPKVAD